jgi:hypothetical protein
LPEILTIRTYKNKQIISAFSEGIVGKAWADLADGAYGRALKNQNRL